MLGQPRVGNWKQLDYRYRLSRRALQEACSQPRPIVRLAVSIEPSGPTMIPSSERMTTAFIHHPGLSGPFGALMDEYARAAEDFCRVVESFDLAGFDAERPSNNPNTISPRAICLHVIGAAHRYAHYIRKARGVDFIERYEADPARLHSPRDVRGLLTEGIALAEQTVAPLLKATEQEIQALSFAVRWGARYDPEMILEHAVCHLLRHRRQLERW